MTKELIKNVVVYFILHYEANRDSYMNLTQSEIADIFVKDFSIEKQYHQQDVDLKGLRELANLVMLQVRHNEYSGKDDSFTISEISEMIQRRLNLKPQASDAWISISTPPPLPNHNCWAHYYWGYIPVEIDGKTMHMVRKIKYTMGGDWFYESTNVSDQITHWMELNTPQPPINSKTTEGLLRYKCGTCGNTCLVNHAPDNSICGGCDKPDWKLMEDQEPYKTTEG